MTRAFGLRARGAGWAAVASRQLLPGGLGPSLTLGTTGALTGRGMRDEGENKRAEGRRRRRGEGAMGSWSWPPAAGSPEGAASRVGQARARGLLLCGCGQGDEEVGAAMGRSCWLDRGEM